MREENVQSYYPSARVRVIVRFEDFGAADVPKPPVKPPHLLRGVKDKSVDLLTVQDQGGRLVLLGPGDDPTALGGPQAQTASSDGRSFSLDGLLPHTASHCRNGIRQGDTLNVTLVYADLPFDPRLIRAAAVEYYLGCVTPDDYQRGIAGELRTDATPSTPLAYHVVPDQYLDRYGRLRDNLRFQGWVDMWEVEFPEGDVPVVRLQCSDNTRLFLDQEAPPKLTIGSEVPIDRAIADYLSNFPQFRGMGVEYRPNLDRSRIPILKDSLAKTKYQPRLGPAPSGSKLKVWDYITDVVGSIGHVSYVDRTTVVIQRARTLYDGSLPARPDDPFVGRLLPSGRRVDRRLYVFGHNVRELSSSRKYTTVVPENIEVRSYDSGSKKTIVARFPAQDDRQSRQQPGDAANQKWRVIRITGITDKAVLQIAAQSAYEQLGRREIGMRLVTKNLGSFGGDNLDPDALDAEPGDAVDVEVKRETVDQQTTVVAIEEQMRTRPAAFLRQLGYGDALATAYAKAAEGVGLASTYRITSCTSEWDREEGVTLDFELANYVEVRCDKELPDGEAITMEDVADAEAAGQPLQVIVEDDGGG